VYPGIRASISFSARSTIVAINPLRYSLIVAASSSYNQVDIDGPHETSLAVFPLLSDEPCLLRLKGRTHEPKPQVSSDLIVPAPTRMQLPSDVLADNLRESSLISSVNVLIVRLSVELYHPNDPNATKQANAEREPKGQLLALSLFLLGL
jgi:hypothetical protein